MKTSCNKVDFVQQFVYSSTFLLAFIDTNVVSSRDKYKVLVLRKPFSPLLTDRTFLELDFSDFRGIFPELKESFCSYGHISYT